MTLIEKPVAGQPMRAGWGASVAERLNQIGSVGAPRQLVREGMFGQGVAPLPKNQRDRRGTPAAPQPYEVRWAQSVNDGAGNWIIWLPTGQELIVGGTVVDLSAALSAAGDPYPDGWYELSDLDLSQGGEIWLNITIPADDATDPSAEFSDEPDDGSSAATDDQVIPILVATIEVDSTTGAKRAYQNLVGALVLGGGLGADDLEFAPAPFDIGETKRDAQPGEEGDADGKVVVSGIVNCKFFWDGAEKMLPDFPIPGGTATVYLNCVGTASQSASAVNGYTWTFAMSTSEVSTGGNIYRNYKLYDFNAGEVSMDWRSTFLALYSGTANRAEPDGVSIDKIPDAAPGTTPTGDEGKLEIKGFKSATSSELTLSSSSATTFEFLARNPGNPSSLVYRTLKVPAADSVTLKPGTIVVTSVTWDTASGVNQYSIKITRGYLKIGDGNGGTTKGEIYVEADPQETLTRRIPSVPFTPSMAQTS